MAGRSARIVGAGYAGDRASVRVSTDPTKRTPRTGDGADQPLAASPLSPIARRAALMRLAKVGIRHDAAAPHRRDEIVLADDAVAVLRRDGAGDRIPAVRLQLLRSRSAVRAGRHRAHDCQIRIARENASSDRNPARTINQGVLKDKSIIRQSLAARLQAFEGPLDEVPLSPRRKRSVLLHVLSSPPLRKS